MSLLSFVRSQGFDDCIAHLQIRRPLVLLLVPLNTPFDVMACTLPEPQLRQERHTSMVRSIADGVPRCNLIVSCSG